jgi:predicted TIM-barrel fold metal-dependent hydrolase
MDLNAIPVIDQHCHPWLRPGPPYNPEAFRLLFTEGVDPRLGDGVSSTIYYRWTIRELARVFDCEPSEEMVLATRRELGHDEVARRLMAEANIEAAVLDYGFVGRGADLFDRAEMAAQLGGAKTVEALRLETLLESLVRESADAAEVEARFRARLNRTDLLASGVASLKSIVAYRSGLAIAPADRTAAYAAFPILKQEAETRGTVRIVHKAFLDYFLDIALAWANEERFPVQFHTGFGDPTVFLRTGNPIMLREVLESSRYRDVPLVLLHAGWPYIRELSYLASVYPNVWADFGLAIPFAATDYETIIRQLLSLAPASRILYSSDGFAIPEHAWFAAVHGRRALAAVLDDLVMRDMIGADDAWEIANQLLRTNARRLYRLDREA